MPDSETPLLPLMTPRSWAVAGDMTAGMSPPLKVEVTEGLALFHAAPAAGANGYAAWKAAMVVEKAAGEMQRRNAELPVHSEADGFARWKEEAETAKRTFERRWGVPLGKVVRVQLRGESREREGLLRLVEEPAKNSTRHLRLTLGGHVFLAAQIESLVRV
jgi:hypothetical protein